MKQVKKIVCALLLAAIVFAMPTVAYASEDGSMWLSTKETSENTTVFIATDTTVADGLLEVFLVRAPRNLTEISECIQALQSQRYNDCAMITFGPARQLKVFADETMPWTLDGEKFDGQAEIEVKNLHHAIRLMQKVNHHA